MSAMASLTFAEQRIKNPKVNPMRADFAKDPSGNARDLLYGTPEDKSFMTSMTSGRRHVQLSMGSKLPTLPSGQAPWGQSDQNTKRGKQQCEATLSVEGKGTVGNAPWEKEAPQQMLTSKKSVTLPALRDKQDRGHCGVPWGDDTVSVPASRKVMTKTPYYTEDSIGRMMEVAQHDPAMPRRAQAKKTEASPSHLFEVWDRGECVHIAETAVAAQDWAQARHLFGAKVRTVPMRDEHLPNPLLHLSPSPPTAERAYSKGEISPDAIQTFSRSAKSAAQVTFNPQVTYSETPHFPSEALSDSPKSSSPIARLGRRRFIS